MKTKLKIENNEFQKINFFLKKSKFREKKSKFVKKIERMKY